MVYHQDTTGYMQENTPTNYYSRTQPRNPSLSNLAAAEEGDMTAIRKQ